MINNRKIAKTLAGLAGTLTVIVLAFLFSGPSSKFSPVDVDVDMSNKPEVGEANISEVVRVIDGDTIVVKEASHAGEEKVRMIGVDTPEVVDPRKTVQCFGKQASIFTKNLLPKGSIVKLEFDQSQGKYDKYNRLLAYVYKINTDININPQSDSLESINQTLIEQGYAHEYTYRMPYKYQAIFKNAEKEARLGKKGLWADDACAK